MPQPSHLLDPPLHPDPSSSRPRPPTTKRRTRLSPKNSHLYSLSDPSSGLLALLVTVAGSSSVHGRPLESQSDVPPDFLCPRLYLRAADSSSPQDLFSSSAPCDFPQPSTSSQSPSGTLPDQSAQPRKKRSRRGYNIADKYEQSPDGRWRKVDSWELYGSSSCAVTQCMDTSATELPVQDDQVSASPSSSATDTSSSSTSTLPSLPNGWGKTSPDGMTGIILALSLSLAIILIIFMMGIVLWRKKRRKHDEKDTEKTASVRGDANSEVSEEIKRARSQQRMWARASAKWMANVRQSARLRRKRKAVAKGSDCTLLDDSQPPQASSSALSLTRTCTITDRDSTYSSRPRSIRSRSRTVTRSRSPSLAPSSRSRCDDNDEPQSPPPQPPAYPSEPHSHRPHAYRSSSHHSGVPRRRSSHSSLLSEPPPPCSATHSRPSSPVPYEPPIDSAHVATDDKNILARMVRLASAPPPADGPSPSSPGGSSELYPSVPVLEDDGFEPLPPELQHDVDGHVSGERAIRGPGRTPDTPPPPLDASSPYPGVDLPSSDIDSEVPSYTEDARRHPALVLPPPPSKIALAGPMFYEYPNEFEEDVVTTEPPLGPSSPPFEEQAPSAPPFQLAEGPIATPSAPPLDFADEPPPALEVLAPSAPPLGLEPELGLEPQIAHGTSADSYGNGESAPQAAPDDHGGVNPAPSAGAASVRQASAYNERDRSRSPPGYLP
ncbi:hypothetical protein L227DRAFT_607612 [Lentinus tigrinus ALCF2SS1-6]|uniref:Uncharacterized protein n=1 Tax=Lentinus tigrinus ALCF2SS1-6 TaxID=1328759 RepID=A0A5C2SPF3_9APHY|nr:hypothetical protein L227DRAFT_607612 [Lentinus tigrinus ALCF2SS1-6]